MNLSSRLPIDYIDLRVFAHATEDLEKVLTAIHNILPPELSGTINFEKSNLNGHHGNLITLIETRIEERDSAQAVFEKLARGLRSFDKGELNSEIQQHLEKGSLYLRLDKQSAYFGEFRLWQIDPIRLKIHFRKHTPQEIVEICRKLGLLP